MFKKVLLFVLFSWQISLCDELNIDNLFKKQSGIRSITTLQFLSTGNANSYSTYPNLSITGDPNIWDDTKQLSLNQSIIYTLNPSFDLLVSGSFNYARKEYSNIFTSDYSHESKLDFSSFWLGFIYTAPSIGDLVPQISFQTAIAQRERALSEAKNFYLKSQNLQITLRGYSDPVVFSVYSGLGYNQKRNFEIAKINYGHSIYFGGDLSIILSPKISLDLGFEQRFQTKQKINGQNSSNIRSIPSFSLGSTYSWNSKTALSLNSSFGGSSAAPDAMFGLSLWKKF